MIERDPPFFWDVSCDRCSTGEERISTDEAPHFLAVVEQIKSEGWKVKKVGGEWEHYCPECNA
jgi:hypothetical protein